ncbi:uncharacterized protein LOC128682101 [Plodia interpunctella]|uniref:uncharacterized protein LOC128682101 n=1 Tax=Plodia interpunctella TaxID=58824 RepID=UPI0023676F8F|nr:uncharacterized protein LOC128682101 [Plodia interpunctella]
MNLPVWKTALCASGTLICGLAFKVLQRNLSKTTNKTDINEFLFYGSEDETRTREIGIDNLYCIYYLLAHANKSIDICVPSLESGTIAQCLINVQQRNNARIRIAIHNSDNYHHLNSFAKCGIQVKVIKSNERLEHEFILIDSSDDLVEAVAVIGSIDYETSRVNCNRDATLLTSDAAVVSTLKKEFDRVWTSVPEFKPEKDNK